MTIMSDHRIAGAFEQDRRMLDFVGTSGTIAADSGVSGSTASLDLVIEDLDDPAATCPAWTFCI